MKILHISDLHLCDPALKPMLEVFQKEVADVYKIDIDIHTPDEAALADLKKLISKEDPDIIALTGDITTFGDAESYRMAAEWLRDVSHRSGAGGVRKVVVVPGNHDALDKQLSALINGWALLKIALRFGGWLRLLKPLKTIQKIIPNRVDKGDLLKNFNNFVADNSDFISSSKTVIPLASCPGSRIVLFPFDTLSSNPLWLNLGEVRTKHCRKFVNEVESEQNIGCLKIVLCHHNPVSSPGKIDSKLVNAYNSMPGGTEFLQMLQKHGVNIVLYGHQHVSAAYAYDFDLKTAGQAYALASACSSESGGGCNVIEIRDINHVSVRQLSHDPRRGFILDRPETSQINLALERNRPTDGMTIAARLEIKGFLNGKEEGVTDFWNDLHREKKGLVYMSGRHFKMYRTNEIESITRFLNKSEENRLRLLITDPNLARKIASAGDSTGKASKIDMWGATEELNQLAGNAANSINSLVDYVNRQPPSIRSRIDVRMSHTIMPFAAIVSEADKAWSKMAVRILPVGAYGAVTTPLLMLNRRVDETLFEFYLKHMRFLFLCGTKCAGEWGYGDGDLQVGFDPVILERVTEGASV